ncbi:MAG: inorganic pyrophosphatase [Oscillospiraceae bacterium]|nr:inorganic pyrophosphatase [Oscillospiraceae bacterium]
MIGRDADCRVDRPLGSAHPRFADLVYPVNYGYVVDVMGGDGAEQDVYILGEDEPLESFQGKVIAVYHRLNDNEDKWIVAKEGSTFTEKEILESIAFQERFFDGELYM